MVDGIESGTLSEEQEHLRNTAAPPMSTMLQKQHVSEAIAKQANRQQMSIQCIPATVEKEDQGLFQKRKAPLCSICNQPMKGHKNVKCCPKNL